MHAIFYSNFVRIRRLAVFITLSTYYTIRVVVDQTEKLNPFLNSRHRLIL